MLGGMELSVDGEARALHDQMTYKGVLVQDIPNLAWMFGYTNAPWTLKSDLAGEYLVPAVPAHGRQRPDGGDPARPRGLRDGRRHARPAAVGLRAARQGRHAAPGIQAAVEGTDALREGLSKMLLDDPVEDDVLQFDKAAVDAAA